jgi:DNA-binding NarL/FixJ family response regulator
MNNNTYMQVVVAETSSIVRSGVAAVLKRLPNFNLHIIEITSPDSLHSYMQMHIPDLLIVNPSFGGWFDLAAFKAAHNRAETKIIALLTSVIDDNLLRGYDEQIALYDHADTIADKLDRLFNPDTEADDDTAARESEQETLSQREKEIIICVVKGLTNKAIADQLFLSIHTVITHRRNIARKLQIHSPAGLTIYAIVNKLVELQDIKGIV